MWCVVCVIREVVSRNHTINHTTHHISYHTSHAINHTTHHISYHTSHAINHTRHHISYQTPHVIADSTSGMIHLIRSIILDSTCRMIQTAHLVWYTSYHTRLIVWLVETPPIIPDTTNHTGHHISYETRVVYDWTRRDTTFMCHVWHMNEPSHGNVTYQVVMSRDVKCEWVMLYSATFMDESRGISTPRITQCDIWSSNVA